MPFTKFTNLDFDQIKTSIKDYIRSNSDFTDFDFEGSNFSVLIDTLAYNTYITAVNSNMVVNESFLDSAVLRENVVSLARNIGYVPRSRTAATATIRIADINLGPTSNATPKFIVIRSGLICIGNSENTTYRFSIPDNITSSRIVDIGGNSFAQFDGDITIYEGTYLSRTYLVDTSVDQRYIIDSPNIDSSTLRVYVKGPTDIGLGRKYSMVDNILNIDKNSEIYLAQEVQDEKYEIMFGDGLFGRKLENNSIIISTIKKMNQKEVKGYKNKIQAFISKELNNYSITVDVSLDEVKQKKNFVNSKDKLDALIKENNNISLLINESKLRI